MVSIRVVPAGSWALSSSPVRSRPPPRRHRSFAEAKQFYLSYATMVAVAAGIVLIPRGPLGLITTNVRALAGLLLPSASVFLLLLCNDREVLGPWVNPRWLNLVAAVIVGVLLIFSGTLLSTTLFPTIDVTHVFIGLALASTVGGVAVIGILRVIAPRVPAAPQMATVQKMSWRMPHLPCSNRCDGPRSEGWDPLAARLVDSASLLLVKAVQLGQGH